MAAQGQPGTVSQTCCLCGRGEVQSGSYSFVDIEDNDADYPHVVDTHRRYTVNWTADKNGFKATVTNTTDNAAYTFDRSATATKQQVINPDESWSYRLAITKILLSFYCNVL